MTIKPLPDSTSRTISSSLVLEDAASVVKELIDNALDAKATIISVEISANTLDVVQVKDNGSGIGVEDRQLICKRGCTSKIRTIQDLEALGGTYLGFRGEALASIAELSDSVTVTTCVAGEPKGCMLKYGPASTLVSSCPASHPTGTTIRVENFLKRIPVRRQTANKESSKTLLVIRQLLQGYAFARPSTRFSLKVLKFKNEKANWLFAASPTSNILEVAAKIIGKDLAANCSIRSFSHGGAIDGAEKTTVIRIDALLLRTTDIWRNSNDSHFISIDGRPVTTKSGTMKDVVKLYRRYFRNAVSSERTTSSSYDPFLHMHIQCSPGSYDINIEPAKDVVLFLDPSKVLFAVESLFIDFYGPLNPQNALNNKSDVPRRAVTGMESFNVLLADRPKPTTEINLVIPKDSSEVEDLTQTPQTECGQQEPTVVEDILSSANPSADLPTQRVERLTNQQGKVDGKIFHNMWSAEFEDSYHVDELSPSHEDSDEETEDECNKSTNLVNPWSIAKMNVSLRSEGLPQIDPDSNAPITPTASGQGSSLQILGSQRAPIISLNEPGFLPTPNVSPRSPSLSCNQGRLSKLWSQNPRDYLIQDDIDCSPESERNRTIPQHTGDIDSWLELSTPKMTIPAFKASDMHQKDRQFIDSSPSGIEVWQSSGGRGSLHPTQTGLSPGNCPTAHTRKLFKSPMKNIEPHTYSDTSQDCLFDHSIERHDLKVGEHPTLGIGASHDLSSPARLVEVVRRMPPPLIPDRISPRNFQSHDEELAQIMDFERRKKAVVIRHGQVQARTGKNFINPGKPALIQQPNRDPKTIELNSSETGLSRNGYDSTYAPATAFETRFGRTSQIDFGASPSRPNNSHSDCYQIAGRALIDSYPNYGNTNRPDHGTGLAELVQEAPALDRSNPFSRLAEDDPRAYLMYHRRPWGSDVSLKTTTAGHKIRRAKTFLLPLEMIPVKAVTHDLIAQLPGTFQGTDQLQRACKALREVDQYVDCGENSFVEWSAYGKEIEEWEGRLNWLVAKKYRARVGEDEMLVPEIKAALPRAIKTHIDNDMEYIDCYMGGERHGKLCLF